MAIVQLVYLSRDTSAVVTEFWYYNSTYPDDIKAGSESLAKLKETMREGHLNAGSNWAATTPFPASASAQPDTGMPLRLAIAIGWTESGPTKTKSQPSHRYWIVQPGVGKILAVDNDLSNARDRYMNLIGAQVPF